MHIITHTIANNHNVTTPAATTTTATDIQTNGFIRFPSERISYFLKKKKEKMGTKREKKFFSGQQKIIFTQWMEMSVEIEREKKNSAWNEQKLDLFLQKVYIHKNTHMQNNLVKPIEIVA